MIIGDYDGAIYTSRVPEPATMSSIQILNRLREMKAVMCHMQEVREDLRRTRFAETERTRPTIPQVTVPKSINDVASTEQMRLDKEGGHIRATMISQSGGEVPRAVEPGGTAVVMTPKHGREAQTGGSLVPKGRFWRCNQEGHSGHAQVHIRKYFCTAFNLTCQKCKKLGHSTSVCNSGKKRTKDHFF